MTFWASFYIHAFPGLLMLWMAIGYRLYLRFKYPPPRKMTEEEKKTLFAALTRRSFFHDYF